MQRENRSRKILLPVLILGGLVFVLICNLLVNYFSAGSAALSQADSPSTELAQAVEATIAARDVQIPITAPTEPASTRPPTKTPKPTQTHAPTATTAAADTPSSTNGPSGELSEAAYLAKISDLSVGCQKGLYGIAEQSEKASENTLLMFEAQWKGDLETALFNVEEYCVGMRDITPVPPRFATLHQYVGLMAEEMDEMVDDYRYGVENMDAGRLSSASDHMRKGTEYVEKMGDEMQRINNP